VSKIEFDEVPKHHKKFVIFDLQGNQLGWQMSESEWQAVEAWNTSLQETVASSAVGVE
jgi:hypothetical protein